MTDVLILTTGGTIDKIYFDAKSEYEVGPPNIEEVLGELNLAIDYSVQSLMRKDSLDLTDQDRQNIVQAVTETACKKVMITHGTDTMVETANALGDTRDKTIILTGALRPALFKNSDAVFNIGCALAAVQVLPPGKYIAMNGTIFTADNVKKNVKENRFEKLR